MVIQKTYFKVIVPSNVVNSLSDVREIAVKCNTTGIEEYSMEEKEVDEVLGPAAYCGGELPIELVSKVESFEHKNVVQFYFDKKEDALLFQNEIKVSSELEEHPNEDWNQPWREHYKPIVISERLQVIPEWLKEKDSPSEIYIYPGMGFGTGTHETTSLCLKILVELNYSIKSVLDFGCGSGILGIAAIKLFNSSVDFCDIDKEALYNTVQNLEINFPGRELVGCRLVTREKYKADKQFDLVFANILAPILKEEAQVITDSTKTGGDLILSGLLIDQTGEIIEHYVSLGFQLIGEHVKNDWSALHFRKR